ncbi:nucleolar protein 12 [Ophiocordyceps camponoti-floridani]|uniref:Nucleolar protein 12 n=1 Tax=Ophiocordyceps camponoti-floridani TaxID=2030778 RepID=A0A8H4VCM9_9HYPO|nr:nucleolar protein 12 [Ophiocordyceps camponoti-floridani]
MQSTYENPIGQPYHSSSRTKNLRTMFAKPRLKKSILPPLGKKRKLKSTVEEVTFDDDARLEFLTGFHKRKQLRVKRAQELAAKRAHQEKLDMRKQIRSERRREVEQHVETVNRMLRESGAVTDPVEDGLDEDGGDEWDGFPDKPNLDIVDHEEEYIDEDRFTTVTVETVTISRDGLDKAQVSLENGDEEEEKEKREWTAAEEAEKEEVPI